MTTTQGTGNSARLNKRAALIEEHKGIINFLLNTNSVRVQPAVEVGKKTVEYFRGKDFVKWVYNNEATLREKFPLCFLETSKPLTSNDVVKLGNALIRFNFIYRAENEQAMKTIVSGVDDLQTSNEASQRKWPKRLVMSNTQLFSESSYFVIVYELPSSWPYIMLFLVISSVIVVCMFPAWPLVFKLAVWYISVSLMAFILGSVILRLVTFLVIWFCGFDFWIFPNLFDEERGVVDSFIPVHSLYYRNDSWVVVIARFFLALLTAASLYQLNQTHSISDARAFATRQFLDVLVWGHQKLSAPIHEEGIMLHNTNDVLDFTCLKLCGFHDFEALKQECLSDCACIKELISSPCYPKCRAPAQTVITDAEINVCDEASPSLHPPDEL